MSARSEIIKNLKNPSSGRDWYEWGAIGAFHYVLGLWIIENMDVLLNPNVKQMFIIQVAVSLAYLLVKEIYNDIFQRDATWLDSIVDAYFLALGIFAIPFWSINVFMASILIGWFVIIRKDLI